MIALAYRNPDLDTPKRADLLKRAAEEGWSTAQFLYSTQVLDGRSEEAQLWLAMAVAQGDPEAAGAATQVSPPIKAEAERHLLAMAADPATQLGKAAQWCDRQPPGRVNDRQCRLHALDHHIDCRLFGSTTAALGISVFEITEAYARCRSTLLEYPQ
jgi:hypothetical protein